jgi:hypothetical protein
MPVQTGQQWVFCSPPNAVVQSQKIFVLVASSECISSPTTVSKLILSTPFSNVVD